MFHANGDQLGYDVALSGDANTMAVGAYDADFVGATNAGLVRLYSRDGMDWNVFQQINGPDVYYGRFGWSLNLSHDGSTLAVGARYCAAYIYS